MPSTTPQPRVGSASASDRNARPLCVDLDGTLIAGDCLWEGVVRLAFRHPLRLVGACLRLPSGKAAFKAAVAAGDDLDPAGLPYRREVIEWLGQERASGRRLVLATAADRQVADAVAAHLGLFDEVLCSDGAVNLGSQAKRDALVRRFGKGGFDYAGDHGRKDLPVFEASGGGVLVAAPDGLAERLAARGIPVLRRFSGEGFGPQVLLKALRVHQWVKNLLIFVPLLTAHLLFDLSAWSTSALAFLAFSLLASGTYLVNDLHDLQNDRRHPSKHRRPLASGRLPIPGGIALAAGLIAAGISIGALLLPVAFLGVLLGYLGLTLAYSFFLKSRLLVDVVGLALLYTIRIVAGAMAIGVALSPWLLMFSLFVFTSLAFLKRYVELRRTEPSEDGLIAGRGYSPQDAAIIRSVGPASGLLSVLVLGLYVQSPQVETLYRTPELLWLLVPLMVYWVTRIWFLAERGIVDDDPVEFAVKDWRTQVVVVAMGAVALAAWQLGA